MKLFGKKKKNNTPLEKASKAQVISKESMQAVSGGAGSTASEPSNTYTSGRFGLEIDGVTKH
jgi:hypothetical protein